MPARTAPALGAALLAAALAAIPSAPLGQNRCGEDAMVVFDGSGSMSEMGFNRLNQPRINDARRAVADAMPRVAPYRRLGLIVYGPGDGSVDACANVDLRFPPLSDAAGRIIAEIDALEPAGETPLTLAVEMAAETLGGGARPGVVVLVTDGKETCGGAPCQLAARLAATSRGIAVHVIGFRVRARHFSWQDDEDGVTPARCLADLTGGLYVSTETVDQLVAALQRTLGCDLVGRGAVRPRGAG